MRTIGQILLAIGLLLGVVAFSMDTTVKMDSSFIGDTYIPSREVHNIGLMDERRNLLIVASLLVVVGVQLIIGGNKGTAGQKEADNATAGPNSSKFKGPYDLTSDKYRLYLTKSYNIELNNTLGQYVVGDNLYPTLEDALKAADLHEREVKECGHALLIHSTDPGLAGDKCGLSVGDIILRYGNTQVRSNEELQAAILLANGQPSSITILRQGQVLELRVAAGRLGIYCEETRLSHHEQELRLNAA